MLKFKPNFKFFTLFRISLQRKKERLMWSPVVNLPICNPASAIKLLQIFMKSGLGCFAKSFQASLCFMQLAFS